MRGHILRAFTAALAACLVVSSSYAMDAQAPGPSSFRVRAGGEPGSVVALVASLDGAAPPTLVASQVVPGSGVVELEIDLPTDVTSWLLTGAIDAAPGITLSVCDSQRGTIEPIRRSDLTSAVRTAQLWMATGGPAQLTLVLPSALAAVVDTSKAGLRCTSDSLNLSCAQCKMTLSVGREKKCPGASATPPPPCDQCPGEPYVVVSMTVECSGLGSFGPVEGEVCSDTSDEISFMGLGKTWKVKPTGGPPCNVGATTPVKWGQLGSAATCACIKVTCP